jgi:hypothetical protein
MAPVKTLLRKSYLRGRGALRVRALIMAQFSGGNPGGYTQGYGFCDDGVGAPNNGLAFQSLIPEPVVDSGIGCMVEPRMTLLSSWTGFTHALLGTHGILDFDHASVSNYGTVYKRAFIRLYGIAAGPIMAEAATDTSITGGAFVVEGEYTPISGAEG